MNRIHPLAHSIQAILAGALLGMAPATAFAASPIAEAALTTSASTGVEASTPAGQGAGHYGAQLGDPRAFGLSLRFAL